MDFELDEDDQLLRDNVREFCRQEVVPHAAAWDEAGSLPGRLRTSLGELGLLGLRLPEAAGGSELSMVATVALLEELSAADAAVATMVAVHAVVGVPALSTADPALSKLGSGDAWVGWADGASVTARPDGDAFVLDGAAQFVVGGGEGAPLLVPAGGESPGLFRVDAVDLSPVETLGLRAATVTEAVLEGVSVPAPARVADADGLATLRTAGTIAIAAVAVGQGGAALRAGRDYAMERRQFGRPIAQFQAIKWKVADTATQLDAARLLTLQAAAAMDAGRDAADLAARAKLKAGAAAVLAGSHSLQIHGGYGYTREFPVERALRNARTLDAMLGGSRAHRSTAAQSIVERYT